MCTIKNYVKNTFKMTKNGTNNFFKILKYVSKVSLKNTDHSSIIYNSRV